jgi:hypothetical protein
MTRKGFIFQVSCIILLMLVFLLSSCSQAELSNQNDAAGTLPNGERITAEEKAKLDALKPQVDSIIEEVFGNKADLSDGKQFVVDQNILLDKINILLKKEFGDDYTKFIVQEDHPLVSVKNSGSSSSSMVADISSGSSVSKSISGSINGITIGYKEENRGKGGIYRHTYLLNVYVRTAKTPWFSYNSASQYFSEYIVCYSPNYYSSTVSFSPIYQSLFLGEGDGGSFTVSHINSTSSPTSYLHVIGEMVFGYYPETKSWALTNSFANDTNLFNSTCQVIYTWGQ